jgi:hypothetical protein
VAAALPAGRLDVRLEHAGPRARRITFEAAGGRAAALLAELRRRIDSEAP